MPEANGKQRIARLRAIASALSIERAARHIFLCAGGGARCCRPETGAEVWGSG